MKWQDKLTKGELKHIKRTTDTGTLAEFKKNVEHQRRLKALHSGAYEPCWDCRLIARKLGL